MSAIPESRASLWSRLFFAWARPVLAKADRLDAFDMLPLAAAEQTAACASAFARGLAEARHRRHPVLAALSRVHRRAFVATVALGILHAATNLAAPYFLRGLLEWLELPDGTLANGLALAAAIFVAGASSWLAIAHCFFLADKLSIRVRAGLVVALHAKTLKLGGGRAGPDAGQVLNVLSNDLDRVVSMPADIAIAIMSVVILAIAVVMLWTMLGSAALAGLAVLAALVPIARRIARSMSGANAAAQAIADRRLAMTSDLLRGIRAIKLASLEGVFARKLGGLRAREGKALRRFSLLSAAVSALFLTAPVLVAFAVFALHSALGQPLDVATAFSSIAVFGLLRPVLLHLPAVISNVVQAATSLGRIEHVLATPESAAPDGADLPTGALRLRASRVGRGETALLSDVTIDVAPGELVVITGGVGSGKSTLIDAMLGDRGALDGTVHAAGRIAVATQEPYLVSGTVRENILLGAPYDADRYRAALAASCMVGEVARMPAGDATRIADRGGNLSGGQRQRLALARAFYARADIVILDDPFSSLDAVVGGAVAEQGLFELLRGTTRIVVANRADLARRADRVIVLADGRATIEPGGAEAAAVLSAAAKLDLDPVGRDQADADASAEPADAERRASGAVARAVYAFYLSALLSPAVGALVAVLFLVREGFSVGSDYWLSSWSDGRLSAHDFLIGFAALAVGTVIVTYARDAIGAVHAVVAGRTIHDAQIERLLGAPLALHEVTPAGRTLNRLSRDQRIIDQQLGPIIWEWSASVMLVLSTMTVIVLASPIALVPIALLALRYYQLQRFFRASARDLRRLDAVARAPLMSHFADVLGGVPSIRAYRAEDYFSSLASERLELSQRTVYTQEAVRSWISVRLDLLGSTLAGVAAFVAVATRSSIDPRLAALSITYAMIITYTLGRMVRTTLDVESSMSAVERAKECAELPTERWSGEAPPAAWPAAGAVELEGVALRYQPGLPLALEGLSFTLAPGEKVAVVGRTGSGKSSIVAALGRLCEVEVGTIRVDGLDLAGVALKTIRERITVIPQDPFLFEGTVRENLDPEGRFDDARLFEVLERAHVASVVSAMPEGLDTRLGHGSALLSVGQRQMLCLARALLRPSRVLVLDEFTASVDDATEALLLDTVARELAASTVLMIVHRVAAARACDRVIVMERGRIAEQGAPLALLADSNSAFAELVRAAG